MKSLGIFVHYSEDINIPEYVITYLNELSKHFTDIILATNVREITNIKKLNEMKCVKLLLFKNEGYDFGLFYKSMLSTDLNLYNRVAFINDSNILIKSLDEVFNWGENSKFDMWGLTDSYQNVPNSKHKNSYHIQSHFLVFEKAAIPQIIKFFNFIKFDDFFDLQLDKRELWIKIVEDCEIGLSQFMKNKHMKLGAKYAVKNLAGTNYKTINSHMTLWKTLLDNNYPLIKKKIVLQSFDPIYEIDVAKKIAAQDADTYINKYKDKNYTTAL